MGREGQIMSEVKCYYCDDGKCACIFSLGLSAYGIRPDGGGR